MARSRAPRGHGHLADQHDEPVVPRTCSSLNTGDSGVNGTQTATGSASPTARSPAPATHIRREQASPSTTASPLPRTSLVSLTITQQRDQPGPRPRVSTSRNWGGTHQQREHLRQCALGYPPATSPRRAAPVTLIGSGTATKRGEHHPGDRVQQHHRRLPRGRGRCRCAPATRLPEAPTGSDGDGRQRDQRDRYNRQLHERREPRHRQPAGPVLHPVASPGTAGQGNFNVSNNGTAANRIRNIDWHRDRDAGRRPGRRMTSTDPEQLHQRQQRGRLRGDRKSVPTTPTTILGRRHAQHD